MSAHEVLLRRAEVSRLLRRGFTHVEIGQQLGVSAKVVQKDVAVIRGLAERAAVEAYTRLRTDQVDRLLDHHEWLRKKFDESRERYVRRQLRHFVPNDKGEPVARGSTIEQTLDERGDARILEQMTKTVTAISALIKPPAEEQEPGVGSASWVPPGGATILTIPATALPVSDAMQRALARMPADPPALVPPREPEEGV